MKKIINSREEKKKIDKAKIRENFSIVFKSNKGITLIALVVTIIILIILAGVSIALVLGDNGIITKAREQQKTQDIARISEKLELEKGQIGIENEYKATLDKYVEQIVENGIIKEQNIVDNWNIEFGKCYIEVEDKYVYLLEQEDDNIKITYIEDPLILRLDTQTTTNSIKVNVKAVNTQEVTYEYYIKLKDGEYGEKVSKKDNQYIYENLEQEKIYTIKVVLTNKLGKKSELEKNITLGKVEALTQTNTTFDYSETEWTNKDVTVTASTTVEGYILQTSKDGQNWSNVKSQTFDANGTIYARVVDSTNQATGYTSANIENIDKTAPDTAIEYTGTTTQATLPVTMNAKVTYTDENSGVNITSCKYVLNTTSSEIGTNESSYTGGTFTENEQTIEINPNSVSNWYLHVLSIDSVGNKKETIKGPITVQEGYHTHTGSTSSSGGCYTKAVYRTENYTYEYTCGWRGSGDYVNHTCGKCGGGAWCDSNERRS